jgi:hypothetical protein
LCYILYCCWCYCYCCCCIDDDDVDTLLLCYYIIDVCIC